MIARVLTLVLAVPAVGLAVLAIGARLVLVQPTAPEIGPQPTFLRDPTCVGMPRAVGACSPDWVTSWEYDRLAGGYDI